MIKDQIELLIVKLDHRSIKVDYMTKKNKTLPKCKYYRILNAILREKFAFVSKDAIDISHHVI